MKNQQIKKGDVVVYDSLMGICDGDDKDGFTQLTTINNRQVKAITASVRLAAKTDADWLLNAKGWVVTGDIALKGTLRIDFCNNQYRLQPRGTQWLNWSLHEAIARRKELDEAIHILKIIDPIAKRQWELNN